MWKLLVLFFLISIKVEAAPSCQKIYAENQALKLSYELGLNEKQDLNSRFLFHRYLRKWKAGKLYASQKFENQIEESYEILRKIQIHQGLIDDRSRDFSSRPSEIVEWTERALMKEGLKGYLLDIPENQSLQKKIYLQVAKIFRSGFMKMAYSVGTQSLPKVADKEFPADLLAKISIDGLDRHFEEAQYVYKLSGQNRVENYRRLRLGLRNFMLFWGAMMSFQSLENADDRQQQEQMLHKIEAQKQFDQFEKNLDALDKAISKI
jgi:hypothetical protein